jgi:hypothetical protein
MTASDTPPPLTDEEVQAIRALWVDIRTAHTEKTAIGEMVPVDIDLFDAKLPKVFAEVDRLRAELEAVATDRDVWKRNAIDAYLLAERRAAKRKAAAEDDMRRQIILREINQGALAGLGSEISESAADLVLKALNAYDAWTSDTTHWKQDDATQEADRARAAAALGETGGTDEDRPEHECGNDWFTEGDFCGGCDRDQAEAPGEQR